MQATLLCGATLSPRFVRQAAIFYGILAVIAATWNGLRDRGFDFLGDSVGASILFGTLTAFATVFLGLVTYRLFPVFEKLAEELAPMLVDDASRFGLVLVSVFSGVGEEMFFRGVLQEEFGLIVASIVFGVVHIGPDRRYLVWTAWAVLAGFLFGFLYELTGGLLAPMLAHMLHNAATLLLWKRHRESVATKS